MLIFSSISAYY